jgi:UDP-N-acetylmuramoylalanine--D-glutamate ligase
VVAEQLTELTLLDSWRAEWSGLRVVVDGLGRDGFAVVDTLVELGCDTAVVDEAPDPELARLVEVVGARILPADEARAFAPQLVVRGHGPARAGWDAPVWSDVELAWRVRDKVSAAPWIAVTGDGASQTVDVLLHLLTASGRRAVAVGENAPPVLDAVRDPSPFDILVVELGAERLGMLRESGATISPIASACVGTTATDVAELADLGRVYENTRLACVYDKASTATMRMVEEADVVEGCRAIGVDLGMPGPSDLGLVEDIIVDRAFHDDRHREALELTTHGELEAAGIGDPVAVRNVLAACALARAVDVLPAQIAAAIGTFATR